MNTFFRIDQHVKFFVFNYMHNLIDMKNLKLLIRKPYDDDNDQLFFVKLLTDENALEAATGGVLQEKMFLKILQNS